MTRSKTMRTLILAGLLMCLLNPDVRVNGQELDYAPYVGIPAGWKLIEGDILVPDIPLQATFPNYIYIYRASYWPAGIVPYEFDENVSPDNQARMLAAMAEWEAVANIQFVDKQLGHNSYLYIYNSDFNASGLGMPDFGKREVFIANWDYRFIMAHELGHALGFWHEQSRPDRDEYVMINRANVNMTDKEFVDNFGKKDAQYTNVYGPYDFDSLMHYDQYAFSICLNPVADPENCRTITVKPPWDVKWQDTIGQRDHLSNLDALTMSFLYPDDDWVFVNGYYALAPAYTGLAPFGTFLSPYREFTNAAWAVPPGGTVIIQPGVYSAVGEYTNAMTLRAPLGSVTLGE